MYAKRTIAMIGTQLLVVLVVLWGISLSPGVESLTLITFDVDGTLVRGSGGAADRSAHARAFGHAISQVLNDGEPVTPVAEALPRSKFHGSTDGLILLRHAHATLGLEPDVGHLDELMDAMYDYVNAMEDSEIADGITVLPGVLDHLKTLAGRKEDVVCGLVTGNVEGIARLKMRSVGVLDTNALSDACEDQRSKTWKGAEDIAFLGGFGSDYCSGQIFDDDRNHLDRGEQIAIAARRCSKLSKKALRRVVHVGDAPADVLAAKSFSEQCAGDIVVGMVAVATGSYPADELTRLAGKTIPGRWEPVILENGMADPDFLQACGI